MIIDLLQDKNNIITVSYADSISNSLTNSEFSTKNSFDIPSWRINSSISNAYMTVKSISVSKLKEIDFTVSGSYENILIETSLDGINWIELPFIKDASNNIYKFVQDINGTKYYVNLNDFSSTTYGDLFEYLTSDSDNSQLLTEDGFNLIPDTLINSNNDTSYEYVFSKYNNVTRTLDDLYNNYEFLYLRITVFFNQFDYPTTLYPFYFSNLSISIDENFDDSAIDNTLLSVVSSNFFRQKVFETQDFFPNMIQTFCKMLESNLNSDGSRNGNDGFYQLINLDSFSSVEKLLNSSSDKDLNFVPVSYNLTTKKYQNDPTQINMNNSTQIRDYLINEYMFEYKNFFNDIYNRDLFATPNASTYSDDDIKQLNTFMLKNISKLNSIKGSQKLIEIILSLYADILGYNLISVISGQEQNFVYRITSDIPLYFWNQNIKPIVHPCGWSVIYNYIDSIVNDFIIQNSPENENATNSVRETYYIDNVALNNINVTLPTTVYDGQMVGNFATGAIENSIGITNYCSYSFIHDPTALAEFISEFDNTTVYTVYKTTVGSNINYTIDYAIAGVATSYNWNIYYNGTLINTINTVDNSLTFNTPSVSGYSVVLNLNCNNFFHRMSYTLDFDDMSLIDSDGTKNYLNETYPIDSTDVYTMQIILTDENNGFNLVDEDSGNTLVV